MKARFSNLFVSSGILLLFAGVILYVFTGYYILCFTSLFIGAILIFLSKINWKFRLLIVGLPLAFVGYSFYNSFTTPERYLFFENYRGPVYVFFNQKSGQPKEYEGKRRLYRIPSTGVLFTQFNDEQGWINQDYYLVFSNGQRKKLGVLDSRDFNEEWTLVKNAKEPPRDSLAVFNPRTMGTMGNSNDTNSMVFLQLWIGTYDDMAKTKDFTSEYIDSLRRVTQKNGL